MRRNVVSLLACPRTGAAYELDLIRVADDEVIEAFLVTVDDRDVRPLIAGIAILPLNLRAHMRAHGNVYRRTPVRDPRMVRFVLGQAGAGHQIVPFEDVVARYRDLAVDPPPGYETEGHPDDAALAELLTAALPTPHAGGCGLVIGCGVGRGTFVLAPHVGSALGVDRSVACVRRARNIAVTREHFFLPAPPDSGLKEIRIDLGCLVRDGADFAVADPQALPLRAATMDVVLVEGGDALGTWDEPERVVAEAQRVLREGGLLVWRAGLEVAGTLPAPAVERGPYRAGRPV